MTEREQEIQAMAMCAVYIAEPALMAEIPKLRSSMELCYYLKQFSTRLEILANLRFGAEDR
jgi:hypothetical protein